jgi:hypothetical protein
MIRFFKYSIHFPAVIQIFILLLWSVSALAQNQTCFGPPTVQDCLGAIPVCQAVYSTTASYTGHGNVYPEIHANSLCPLCMDGEKNDVFYIITVQTSGILRFTLTPNNPANDYDWSLFNMTNAGCDQLYPQATSLQVSCNSWGVPGTNGPTGINTSLGNNLNCNGPGTVGVKFNKDLNVLAGQTYLLNVSNWSSTNQSGYTLDFSGSTASIFDVTPAVIDSVQQTVSCAGTDSIYVQFSENVKCADLFHHPEKLSLTGPNGPLTITNINSPDCGTGATNGRRYLLMVNPKAGAGDYTLNIVGVIRDLCDNLCQFDSYPFTMTEINAPVASAGNDTSVANGAIITLHGAASGGTPPFTFHWEPAQYLVNANVAQPVTTNLGATVNFTLSVTDQVGCHGNDDVLVTVVGGPLGVQASALPPTICAGGFSALSTLVSGGSGNYSYSWTSTPPGFTSVLPDPSVSPATTTTYHLQVTDGFSSISSNITVTVNPKPLANAGSNTSIPYGTSTNLYGTASGGSGNYSYSWTSSPPGFSSGNQNPLVTNLQASTVFSLVVTDLGTGCVSEPAVVTVTVTGSPLGCNPVATPSVICKGVSTQLRTMPGGGSGNYTFSWTSTPPGFSSQQENPTVTPTETTIYQVTTSDGFNNTIGQVVVTVRPVPQFPGWSNDTVVCVYETLILNAGNPGATYYWSNGATTRTIPVQTTGIGADNQYYQVKVLNEYGCLDSAAVNVTFSFDACTGVSEACSDGEVLIFPNPATGKVYVRYSSASRTATLAITSLQGIKLLEDQVAKIDSQPVTLEYDLSRWSPGIYLLSVQTEKLKTTFKLFVR